MRNLPRFEKRGRLCFANTSQEQVGRGAEDVGFSADTSRRCLTIGKLPWVTVTVQLIRQSVYRGPPPAGTLIAQGR